jgi:hypothetical protein
MTVEIPKSSRSKLGRLKGIYGCDSLACAVSSVIDDIVIPDILRLVADREVVSAESVLDDPIPTSDPLTTESKESEGSTHERCTDDERELIDLLKDRLEDLKVDTIGQLTALIDADIIKIRNTNLPQISPAGEMPDMED